MTNPPDDPFAEWVNPKQFNKKNSQPQSVSPIQDNSDPFAEWATKPPEQKSLGLWGSIKQGKEKSALGRYNAIKSGDVKKQFQEDLPFWESVAEAAGETAYDFPLMVIGGILGGAGGTAIAPGPGTAIGAGAGGFGLPTLLKSAMNEYIDFENKGGDLTFGDFMKRAWNVEKETGKSLVLGGSMAVFQKMLPFIDKIPGVKKLFDTKYIGKPTELAAKGAAETAALTGGQAALEGHIPDEKDFAKNAILLAGFKGAYKTGELIKNPSRLIPESKQIKMANLQKQFENIPEGGPPPPPPPGGIPLTGYETQKSALQRLMAQDQARVESEHMAASEKALENAPQSNKGYPIGQPPIGGETPLAGRRITPGGQALGLAFRVTPRQEITPQQELVQEVGRVISPNEYRNKTQAAQAGRTIIGDINEMVRRGVDDLYQESRATMAEIPSTQFVALVDTLDHMIAHIEQTPRESRSAPQNQMLESMYGERAKLARYRRITNEDGTPGFELEEYNFIEPQSLIQDVQSIRSKIDNDFTHGNPKNIFLPYLEALQDAIENAARHSGNHEAVDAWQEARAGHRVWAQTFKNNDVGPWLRGSNENYVKLFEKDLSVDKFNILNRVLQLTPEGQAYANANRRVIVEETMGKYLENPQKYTPREINKALAELDPIISPEQSQEVSNLIEQRRRAPPFEAKKTKPKPPEKLKEPEKPQKEKNKYEGKEPEYLKNRIKSISGLKEIRSELEKTTQGKKEFNTLVKQRERSILTEGQIDKVSTGNDWHRLLSNEENFEWFSEVHGEENVQAARKAAKELGKKEVRDEAIKKGAIKSSKAMFFYFHILPLITG